MSVYDLLLLPLHPHDTPEGSVAAHRRRKGAEEIARILNITVTTVGFHTFHIMEALDPPLTAELTQYATSQGLVSV
jgi:DNA-binding CsgD family transcriptional regulator